MHESLISYAVNRNVEYKAHILEHPEKLNEKTSIYIIEAICDLKSKASMIRNVNPRNYIIVVLSDPSELGMIISPQICPSGYLIKPYTKADIEELIDEIIDDIRSTGTKSDLFKFRKYSHEFSIPMNKILFFEGANRYVKVRTSTQEFEINSTLDSVSRNLPDCFLRIHKSYIVNISQVISVDFAEMYVEFEHGITAYISRTYKQELKDRWGK